MRTREWEFRRCRDCKTLFCPDPPGEEHTREVYGNPSYFNNPRFDSPRTGGYHGYKDYLSDRPHIEAKFIQVLEHLESMHRPTDLLDVGAGPGFLVDAARRRGWNAIGLDLNDWAARYAREELGVDVRNQTLQQAQLASASVDAVTMMDVIEHLPDPRELVLEAARITRPNGVLAVLTPDAGSAVSRALGARWPEVQRAPEHLVLFSARGLARLVERNGYEVMGWHAIGKRSDIATLAADIAPVSPRLGTLMQGWLSQHPLGDRVIELNPHTKFCLYARRVSEGASLAPAPSTPRRVPRVPKHRVEHPTPEQAVFEDLQQLARARRLSDWLFDQYRAAARGNVVEIGGGIGTFSRRLLEAGARELLVVEPEPACAAELERRFAGDRRVTVVRETVPDSPALAGREGAVDLVVCQNVLEHIPDDRAATASMARTLRPGGQLTLLVPAHPALFGPLDAIYGHHRRYTRDELTDIVTAAGLEVDALYSFNLLGVPGWWIKNRRSGAQIGADSLRAYEALVGLWRPLEERLRPRWGLSLIVHARRPQEASGAATLRSRSA